MDFLLNLFFGYFLILVAFFFSVMAFTYRKKVFFYVGLGALALSSFSVIYEIEYYFDSIRFANILSIGFALAWVLALVFLILSQSKKSTGESQPVTQEFLDSVINGEDEEWDPES